MQLFPNGQLGKDNEVIDQVRAGLLQAELARRLGSPVSMDEITGKAYPDETAGITVCCATDGNHGRSVAWGAQARKAATEAFGAEVRRCEGNYDSVRAAQETATREVWFVVSDTSCPGYMEVPRDVMQGYEVMAAEAFDALDAPPSHVFLQNGVGGMAAAGVAQAVRRWGADRP